MRENTTAPSRVKKSRIFLFISILIILILFVLFTYRQVFARPEPADYSTQLTMDKLKITIPELKKEYKLLYLTDTHIVLTDDSDTQEVKDNAAVRSQEFVNSKGTPSSTQFTYWMDYIEQTDTDALLLGGDIIDFPSNANISFLEENLNQCKVPYCYTLGNHDWTYPWDYMTEQGKETYLPMFLPFMEDNTAAHVLDMGEFLVLAIDDSSNQVDPDSITILESMIETGRPIILLMHVPVSTDTILATASTMYSSPTSLGNGVNGGIWPDESSSRLLELINDHSTQIKAVLAGHVHFKDENLINDSTLQYVGNPGYQGNGTIITITNK